MPTRTTGFGREVLIKRWAPVDAALDDAAPVRRARGKRSVTR